MPRPQCYMCSALASSREHVPPRNLFPESKDIGGVDYRINLITVPSCDRHNSEKSRDDEFLMVSLAGIIGNNSIGYMHKLGKVDRAIQNSANRLLDQVLIEKKQVHRIEVEPNRFHEMIWGTPDVARLRRCFEHIACGLHRHHFGLRFDGRVHVLLGFLFHSDHKARTWVEFIRDRCEVDLKDKPNFGANPDVFYYQVTEPDEFKMFAMKLTFYGGVRVYLAFESKDSKPRADLAGLLIEAGIKTVFTLGDKSYVFNPDSES
jgi:hypothetical protein